MSEADPDSLPSTLVLLVELYSLEQINLLKSLVRAKDDNFSGKVMILCERLLFRLSTIIKLS